MSVIIGSYNIYISSNFVGGVSDELIVKFFSWMIGKRTTPTVLQLNSFHCLFPANILIREETDGGKCCKSMVSFY